MENHEENEKAMEVYNVRLSISQLTMILLLNINKTPAKHVDIFRKKNLAEKSCLGKHKKSGSSPVSNPRPTDWQAATDYQLGHRD